MSTGRGVLRVLRFRVLDLGFRAQRRVEGFDPTLKDLRVIKGQVAPACHQGSGGV